MLWRRDRKRYCASIGKPQFSMNVKGLELPRTIRAVPTAWPWPMGHPAGRLSSPRLPISQEILRKPVATDRFSFDGKARLIKVCEDVNAVVDSLSVCKFAFLGASIEEYAHALAAATGEKYTGQGLSRPAGRSSLWSASTTKRTASRKRTTSFRSVSIPRRDRPAGG